MPTPGTVLMGRRGATGGGGSFVVVQLASWLLASFYCFWGLIRGACHKMVPKVGLEPTLPREPDFESGASAIPPLRHLLKLAIRNKG